MDANWRWIHGTTGYTNCYTGNDWDSSLCPDAATCTKNCALEGIPETDLLNTYGVEQKTNGVKLGFKRGSNIGSRMYLMETDTTYKMLKLKNREFTFDVDVSTLACGINGAFYLVEMPEDGGVSASNLAGAKYGTGYCDAQCPKDIKFIDGEANSKDWHVTPSGRTFGHYGSCCSEMDLWEANSVSAAVTPHPCKVDSLFRCEGADCEKNAKCDSAGCDFNSWRLGDENFFGKGDSFAVDSSKPFTVVTQFVTADGTDEGDLIEIRRHYVQNGKKIENSKASWPGLGNMSSLTDASCKSTKQVFGDVDSFTQMGGMKKMGESLGRGMVLVLSIWDDLDDHMLWLDSNDPADQPASKPGVSRGSCPVTSGNPPDVRSKNPGAYVTFSSLKYGEIGSTSQPVPPGPSPTPGPHPRPPAPTPAPPSGSGQCCWGASCATASNCQGGWCGDSQDHCEKNCNGMWCPKESNASAVFV
eukprot:TRINITY_DN50531_c0_g1_i1.p1 TRINITY_DN50531_c0_g1~~TRINITY_DN50531_c0_g1_i1.p1  ORF type:complete len:538 (-),score=70.65 TRINITY_DN50531_c0_g1_i1:137-1552(-)